MSIPHINVYQQRLKKWFNGKTHGARSTMGFYE